MRWIESDDARWMVWRQPRGGSWRVVACCSETKARRIFERIAAEADGDGAARLVNSDERVVAQKIWHVTP